MQLVRVASSSPLGLTSKYGFVKIFKKLCLQLQCRLQGLNLVEIESGVLSILMLAPEPGTLIKTLTMMRLAPQFEGRPHRVLFPQHLS